MELEARTTLVEAALEERRAWIDRAGARWSGLVHASALAFVAVLYSNPMYWWPEFERFRLAAVTMGVGVLALAANRVLTGERIRLGLPWAGLLLAYLAFVPLSMTWTLSPEATRSSMADAAKLALVFATVQAAVEVPSRLRRFLLTAALASLGPALGSIDVWRRGEDLVEGYRSHWHGLFGDPNWLAGTLVAVLPFAFLGLFTARRRWVRLLFGAVATAQLAAVVLTHSRSGAVAAGLAIALVVLRGKTLSRMRKAAAAAAVVMGLVAFAPETFWTRNATIAEYETDASVAGRENAWKVLRVIVEERPLTGVGSGAFLAAWDRYAPLDAGGHRYVVHNLLFEIVGELGVIAFGLFVAFGTWLLRATWKAGDDPLVGGEARAIFAGLAGYLLVEMVNGFSMSWFLYFLFACAVAVVRTAARRRAIAAGELNPLSPTGAGGRGELAR
jgi:O-antigen ligase